MSFNLETVRGAWSEKQRAERAAWRAARLMEDGSYATPVNDSFPYSWCKEVWSDFIIVESEGRGKGTFMKIPFTVGADQVVTFGTPKAVKQEYVALSAGGSELLWKESATDRLVALAGKGKKPAFFKKTDEKAQDTEGGSTKDAPAEDGPKGKVEAKKPAADTASKGSEVSGEESLEDLEAWLSEHAAEKETPAYKTKAAKAASLRGKPKAKVGLSAEFGEDSAIVRLTRKM